MKDIASASPKKAGRCHGLGALFVREQFLQKNHRKKKFLRHLPSLQRVKGLCSKTRAVIANQFRLVRSRVLWSAKICAVVLRAVHFEGLRTFNPSTNKSEP